MNTQRFGNVGTGIEIMGVDCPTRPIKNKKDAKELFKEFTKNSYFKKYQLVDGFGAGFHGWTKYLLDSSVEMQ